MPETDLGQATDTTGGAEETARGQLTEAQERLSALAERIGEYVRQRPGVTLLAALGAGFLVGRLARR